MAVVAQDDASIPESTGEENQADQSVFFESLRFHSSSAPVHDLESVDTTYLLRMVDVIHALGARTCDPAGLRDDVLRFHTLAHRIINEGPDLPSPESLQELAIRAGDLGMELAEWADKLRAAVSAK
jgi:hypothetical protein